MKPVLAITRKIFPQLLPPLAAHFTVKDNQADHAFTPEELKVFLSGVDAAVMTLTHKVDAALLDACPRLKAVCNIAVGFNNIDVAACKSKGIIVTNTPDVLNETTADFAMTQMLAVARRLGEAERFLREGKWQNWALGQMAGKDVYGATLGILGMGRIGAAIARRAKGFGMKLQYHNRSESAEAASLVAHYVSFDALLSSSDFLMLVLPYNPQTHYIINAAALAKMKPDAMLINIARGGIVEESALLAALQGGKLAGAALDVFEGEPNFNKAWLDCPNVLLSPHIGSSSLATRTAMAQLALDNAAAILQGKPALTPV